MKQKRLWVWFILLPILLLTPFVVEAQPASPQITTLSIQLWPEYDRPETLVIYEAELSPTTSLPVQLTFPLPGHIEEMHAVATEQNGALIDVPTDAIEMRHEGDTLFLSFPITTPKIHFEYYDPTILNKQDQARQLAFQFFAPYSIETTIFQVKEPYQAQNFTLTPPAGNSIVGKDGLNYHSLEIAGLTPDDTFELSATYNRNTDALSAEQLRDTAVSPPQNTSVVVEPSDTTGVFNETFNWGYILIGAGVVLLLGVGGYWWWLQQKQAEPEAPPRRSTRPGQRRKATPRSASPASGGYCYRCGTALREDAQFCHNCGAERR